MKSSELIACLLIVEKSNELLMKNHQVVPTNVVVIPKVNAINIQMCGRSGGGRKWM